MKSAALKTIVFQTLFAVGMVAASAYCLYISLKYDIAFGKYGQGCTKRDRPGVYWFLVVCYASALAMSLWLLKAMIEDDFIRANWPPSLE